jgi:dTDP-4-amino-4,6-dideoxygalactose transaminase
VSYRVPFVDAREHYRRYRGELEHALVDTVSRGQYIMRQELRDFEARLAAFVGTRFAVGVNSGYHALHLSMLAAGVRPGDEVITVAHTFVATISAIVHCGATPVLVEVGDDYNIDVASFERAITPRTRAVVPVHLNGRMASMSSLMEIARQHGLIVIEDAAQSLGASYDGTSAGAFGVAGCFSFYPFKILGCFGDGGAVTTDDPDIARAVSRMRFNGEDRETGEYHYHGYTALLDNVQAAVLDVKLRRLPSWIEHRRAMAERYGQALAGIADVRLPHFDQSRQTDVFQNYVIRAASRDRLRRHLTDSGIETLVHWPKPVWQHEALGLQDPCLPLTQTICREVLSLPMSAELTPDHIDIVAGAIRAFFA